MEFLAHRTKNCRIIYARMPDFVMMTRLKGRLKPFSATVARLSPIALPALQHNTSVTTVRTHRTACTLHDDNEASMLVLLAACSW